MIRLTKPQKSIYNMDKFTGGSIAVICSSMLRTGTMDTNFLKSAVNTLYRINDALRLRIMETADGTKQTVSEYSEQDFETLTFISEDEFLQFSEAYAKQPLHLYGVLCDVKIIFTKDKYGLLVKLHHIIGDAWTMSLLAKQFNSILDGSTPEAFSYMDYVQFEIDYLQSRRYEKDKIFFEGQFKKCDEVTYLSDKQTNEYTASRKTIKLKAEQTVQINVMAQDNNSSIFAVFMTLFATYFNRIKMNTEKFYIGTPILNRTGIKEQNTAGMFINTVPFLVELDNTKTFCENLQMSTDNIMSLLRHQHYNYEDLLSELRKRYNFMEKLYDVILSYQNAKTEAHDFQSRWYNCGMQTESLQIHIDDRDNEGVLTINYDYRTDIFTVNEIERMHEHIFNLFADTIKNPNKKIYKLNILSSKEKNTLLYKFNNTKADYPKDKCVHQLFEEQAAKTPDKTAVVACDKTLTYNELNKLSNRIANALIEMGIGCGDIVAFALPRRSYLIAVMFGILKSGAAYLPIDPDYPKDRIDYMLSESQARLYITNDMMNKLLEHINIKNPNVTVRQKDIYCALHTSGSTGVPKLSLLTHKCIVSFIAAHIDFFKDIEITISSTIITFDAFIMESVISLAKGVPLKLASEDEIYNQYAFEKMFESCSNIMFFSTPTKMKSYIDNSKTKTFLKNIRSFVIGGEIFTNELYNLIKYNSAECHIFNIYGPTEATICAVVDNLEGNCITIGKPTSNVQIYILDKYNKLVYTGVTGELCIAGDGVGAGYLSRQELTAEKFVDNPFGVGKMYKTGDLAYWKEDGSIVFVGRNDCQVKIRGLRIELGEIESAICSVRGVLQAAAVVRNENSRQLICAFYTVKTEVDVTEIRKAISSRLPKYMFPHIFTLLDEMPLTPSGKINRKALPEVDLHIQSGVEYIAPKTENEKILIPAVESILDTKHISIMDNFFDIGGDSLKAIELLSKLETLGFSTSVKTIFDSENIKALSEKLEIAETAEDIFVYDGDIPATSAQMRIYTAQSMNANSTMYNVTYIFKVTSLDVDKLQTAVDKLIERHEILRTHFENKNGQIVQIINENAACKVEHLKSDDILSFIRPFDLSDVLLIRVGYYKNTIMVDMHHIITDGGSMPVLLKELNDLYMDRELKNKPVQYKQFSIEKKEYEGSKKYWLSVYNDELPELEINTDFPRGQKQSFNGNAVYDTIDIALHKQIIEKCKNLNITPFMFYMGAFNILLSKFSGNEDIIVGIPISGRKNKYMDTIGMFVNTIALRCKPTGGKNILEFLNEVKENSVNAIANQDYPFGELIKELTIDVQNRNPLFDVMFAYQSEKMTDIVFGDEKAELLPVPIITSRYDFTFNIMPRKHDVVLMVEYCTDLYKENTINRMITGFNLILQQMLKEDSLIMDICAISEQEMNKLLNEFNDTIVYYPKDKCVHQLFEKQVAKTPDKTAVIACDKTLTYDELNKLSNRIANALIKKGVEKGDIVAFALPRKSYLIAAIFGILKSGAAYMPIDSDCPRDRIDYILKDSNAKFFITENNLDKYISNNNENLDIVISSNDFCYCIYTSGTTGNSKGTLIRHRNLINFCNNNSNNRQSFMIKYGTRIISTFKHCFDAFGVDYALFLLNGLSLVLPSDDEITDAIALARLIKKYNVDVIHLTPTIIKNFSKNEEYFEAIKTLKIIMVAAENFTPDLYEYLSEYTFAKIFNGYGPSETTIGVSFCEIISTDITIGKPIANTQIYIRDKWGKPVPLGVIGELCIAGDGVGAGYLNRPELTAEKFIDNPFGEGKLYKTGDLAYWREDGNIMFVGRNDFQVKIRGLRIELGEIESVICSVDGISQAVVVVRKDESGRQLICAFYTEKITVDVTDIKKTILNRLPRYMLPHIFTRLDKMPLTPSAKINRKALPEVDLENISNDTEYVKPQTELQKVIARLMEHILKYSPIGLNDDFFDCGGDSLKAIEFVSEAHNEGIYFNLQAIFDNPTVKGLCDYIENDDKTVVQYDETEFSDINLILSKNTIENISMPQTVPVGNILIAGATGYLGIHILSDFLDNDSGIAYCLIRGKNKGQSESRLKELLQFYFEDKYSNLFNTRIKVLCADLTDDNFGLSNEDYMDLTQNVSTVINAAASVKHYGSYKYFYKTNVEIVKKLIDFCLKSDAKLIHTSTLSVSGNSFGDEFDGYISETEKLFFESSLYIGQPLENVYARSKFEAEKEVLSAMANGLKANIMRMGNLTNRFSDGKFQKNHESNAFLQRVRAILNLGIFPDYLISLYAEFTPIDEAANAVMTITRNFSEGQTVFHINSTKVVYMDRLLELFRELKINMQIVDGKTFTDALRQTAKQANTEFIFEAFINDMDVDDKLYYDSNIRIENDFTVRYLQNLGFTWSDIGLEYLRKYINYFREIGYLGV